LRTEFRGERIHERGKWDGAHTVCLLGDLPILLVKQASRRRSSSLLRGLKTNDTGQPWYHPCEGHLFLLDTVRAYASYISGVRFRYWLPQLGPRHSAGWPQHSIISAMSMHRMFQVRGQSQQKINRQIMLSTRRIERYIVLNVLTRVPLCCYDHNHVSTQTQPGRHCSSQNQGRQKHASAVDHDSTTNHSLHPMRHPRP